MVKSSLITDIKQQIKTAALGPPAVPDVYLRHPFMWCSNSPVYVGRFSGHYVYSMTRPDMEEVPKHPLALY
jgi:hypothetical protein